jgi:MFS family permease
VVVEVIYAKVAHGEPRLHAIQSGLGEIIHPLIGSTLTPVVGFIPLAFLDGLPGVTPTVGAARATSIAVGLYLLHNILYARFAFAAGWLADRFDKRRLLAGGYALAAVMAGAVIVRPVSVWTLALVFGLGGVYVAVEETLED